MKRKTVSLILYVSVFVMLCLTGCSGGRGADGAAHPMDGYTLPDSADYSALAWSDAFKAAHKKFSSEYAFSAWKGVDWPGLYNRFLPRIEQAQAAGDEKAYYLALHEYVFSIPDGHVSLAANNPTTLAAISRERAGGGFGLAVAELDDGRVIAASVDYYGQAAQAGITTGAEIVRWGGLPVGTAIGRIDISTIPYRTLTGEYSPTTESSKATSEFYRLEQARLLTRAKVGSTTTAEFKNPGSDDLQVAELTAVNDGGRTLSLFNFAARSDFSSQVDYRILPEGYGYILLRAEVDPANLLLYPTRIFQQLHYAIASFVAAGVPGMILDLRGNYGGNDQLAADLCGFFYSSERVYEYYEVFDKRNDTFLFIDDPLRITPQSTHYSGSVVVLVNPATKSSGEGPPACLSQLQNGDVIGFHGTNGSFGYAGGEIMMPGGYSIRYPFGRSVDQYGVVQLDSRNGIGGVQPTYRVPKTYENVLAFASGVDVELNYAVKYLRGY